MFESFHFYIFILLAIFAVLLMVFNSFIPHHWIIDALLWGVLVVPVIAFLYLARFRDGTTTPFYLLFCALLLAYIFLFAGIKIYSLFYPAA